MVRSEFIDDENFPESAYSFLPKDSRKTRIQRCDNKKNKKKGEQNNEGQKTQPIIHYRFPPWIFFHLKINWSVKIGKDVGRK